jgi:hypothetical protein
MVLLITVPVIFALQSGASAEAIAARHVEGTVHGFLAVRSKDGRVVWWVTSSKSSMVTGREAHCCA